MDLVKDDGYTYFTDFAELERASRGTCNGRLILAVICDDHKKGQTVCMSSGLMEICLKTLKRQLFQTPGRRSSCVGCVCAGKLGNNPEGQKAACSTRRTNCWRVCALILLRPLERRLRMRLVRSFWSKRPTTQNSGGEIQELMRDVNVIPCTFTIPQPRRRTCAFFCERHNRDGTRHNPRRFKMSTMRSMVRMNMVPFKRRQ